MKIHGCAILQSMQFYLTKIPRIASRDNATCILASVELPFHQGVCR